MTHSFLPPLKAPYWLGKRHIPHQHNYCLGNTEHKTLAFMLIADDDARDHANRAKALQLGEQWREAGYIVISMHDDFKTIYGDGVEKTEFTFE